MISSLTAETVQEQSYTGSPIDLRKARMSDIAPVLQLINNYAALGVMLPRTEFEISENIRDFSVAYCGGRLVGCGALHFYSPTTGELRSLAVDESAKAHGVGRQIVECLVAEASEYSLDAVFAFTYVPDFFRKMGFTEVERGSLPLKAWKDCLRCPKFQCCDEIAVMRVLTPEYWSRLPQSGVTNTTNEGSDSIVFPSVRK